MAGLRRLLLRLRNVLRPGRAERELAREMASHLAILEDGFRRQGMTDDEARAAARRAMGGVEQTKERHREARSLPAIEDLRRDLGIAARMLLKARGFTAVVVLTLGAGIGATTAIFSVVNALLLRPLPYPQFEQLVRIVEHSPGDERPDGRPERRTGLMKEDADALSESTTISEVGLYFGVGSSVTWTEGDQVRVLGAAQLQPSALGASRRGILALVLGHGAVLAGIGVATGLAGAFASTRYLESLLFGITPLDPATFVAVAVVFAGVALVASYVPARRATRVDPLVALRSE